MAGVSVVGVEGPVDVVGWFWLLRRVERAVGVPAGGRGLRVLQAGVLGVWVVVGDWGRACDLAGVGRARVLQWRRDDRVFRECVGVGRQVLRDRVEGEVFRRGVLGVEEPVFQGGREVGRVRRFSDVMLGRLVDGGLVDGGGLGGGGVSPGLVRRVLVEELGEG